MLIYSIAKAGIAQLVEQWIENPRVSSSNLDPGIIDLLIIISICLTLTTNTNNIKKLVAS